VNREGAIHFACANALYPVEAIQGVKCIFKRFSTNLRFEDFSWMFPWATENAAAGHMRPAGL